MTVHRSSRKFFVSLSLMSFWLTCSVSPAFSIEHRADGDNTTNEGALDSIWNDESLSKNVASASNDNSSAGQEKNRQNDSGLPLASLESFLDSDFVQSSPWPGVGPFKASNSSEPNSLSDASQNHLNLSVADGKVKSLELELADNSNGSRPFINLEMSLDFLLEGLGVRASKIHELNIDLETNIDSLTDKEPKNLKCGIDPVNIIIYPSDSGTKKRNYRIRVTNGGKTPMDFNEKITTKPHSEEKPPEKQASSSTLANVDNKPKVSEQTKESHVEKTSPPVSSPTVGSQFETPPAAKTDKQTDIAHKDAALKEEFLDVIKHWQQIKKQAIRNGQTTELSRILSGPALAQQMAAVKWLSANHKYYEMTPESAFVEHVTPVLPGKEYVVTCQLKEHRKFVDGTNDHVLKESEENNHVTYKIKKVANNWLIEDSNLVKTTVKGKN